VWKTGSGGRKSRALCCRRKEKRNTFASQSAEVIICMRIKGRSKAHTPSARLKKASSSRCWQHPENFSFPDKGNFSKRLRLCYALSTHSEFLAEIVSVLYVAEKRATHTQQLFKNCYSAVAVRALLFSPDDLPKRNKG
jgi:hypothetical protein